MLALAAPLALGQEAEPEALAPPGLPENMNWTFNFDAGWGAFGFADSLYTDPKPEQPSGDLSDDWFEGFIKPALNLEYTTDSSAQLYGTLSAVGERTYGAPPTLVGEDASSFQVEDLSFGWRSGNKFADLGENALDFTIGRAQYQLGHGMLLWDGAAEGGSRGGYWSNARKAFEFAAIGRFKPGSHTFEAFYLDKDDLPEADSSTKVSGVNYEYQIGEDTTLGATYLSLSANPAERPERDGLDVYDLRAFIAPFSSLENVSFEFEYAEEDNGAALSSTAWNALAALSARQGLAAEVLLPLCHLRGRRRRDRGQRSVRRLAHRLLRLGHLVARRDRRRVLSLELESHFPPASGHCDAEREHNHRTHLLRLSTRPACFGRGDLRRRCARARLVHGLEHQRQLHREFRVRTCGTRRRGRAVVGPNRYVRLRHGLRRL